MKRDQKNSNATEQGAEVQLADLQPENEATDAVTGGEGICHGVTVLAWARVDGSSL